MSLTGAFLSMGFMMNFLSLKEMFLISLQGNPIFGVSLRTGNQDGNKETKATQAAQLAAHFLPIETTLYYADTYSYSRENLWGFQRSPIPCLQDGTV